MNNEDTFPNLREVVGQDAILEGPTAEAIEAALVASKVEAGQLTANNDKLIANLSAAEAKLTEANNTIAAIQPKATAWDDYQAELQGTHPQGNIETTPQTEIERLKAKHPRLAKNL